MATGISNKVAIIGMGCARFGERWDCGPEELMVEAFDEALTDADEVFDDTFFFEGNTHLPIEQHASVGAVDRDGKLTLWSSTQTPHYVHREIGRAHV